MIKTFVSLFLALLCKGSPSGPNAHRRLGVPFRSPRYLQIFPWLDYFTVKQRCAPFFATVQKCERGCALLLSAKHAILFKQLLFWGATSIYVQWEDVREELAKHGGCTTLLPKFCLWGWKSLHGS